MSAHGGTRHILSILVENRFGELCRIVGLFSGRGYNIDSLCVAPTSDPAFSRIILTTSGSDAIMEQIIKQVGKLVRVLEVTDLNEVEHVEREMALLIVGTRTPAERQEVLNLKDGGHRVIVGLRRGSPTRAKAEGSGLEVADTAVAARRGDIVMMLVPDELAPETYERDVAPGLRAGQHFGVAHGFSIHFRKIVPPRDVNVFIVATKSLGQLVRHELDRGVVVLMLLVWHHDPSE